MDIVLPLKKSGQFEGKIWIYHPSHTHSPTYSEVTQPVPPSPSLLSSPHSFLSPLRPSVQSPNVPPSQSPRPFPSSVPQPSVVLRLWLRGPPPPAPFGFLSLSLSSILPALHPLMFLSIFPLFIPGAWSPLSSLTPFPFLPFVLQVSDWKEHKQK